MTEKLKIAVIGGGSSYTPEFVEGIIKRYDELPVDELWLVDVEEGKEKLAIVGNLAKRMVKEANLPIDIFLTLDRQKALYGASFVTTQLRVGMLEARSKDERIPLSHGFIGQETNGAGGLFKGLRTIPVLLEIADDMVSLCPDAWLINFTNPVGMVTEAFSKYSKHKKFIGLCNVPIGVERGVAEILGIEGERVRIDFAGLNHMVYGFNVYIDGQNRTDEVLNIFARNSASVNMENIDPMEWDGEFIKALRLIPCPYHKYYYKTKDMLGNDLEKFKEGWNRAEEVKDIEKALFELYKDEALKHKPRELEKRGGAYYSDAACNLISSIYNDKGDLQVVNTLNGDTIKDLDENNAIEITCKITKDGPIPHKFIDRFPIPIRGLIHQIKAFEILGAEAAVEGNYDKALLAMITNPLVANDKGGRKMLDELLQAHKDYLPNFFTK
ncbi:6-phospho-beta-glucosidase [Tepidimicrobium xylanilyticum]|uniref:6-phospho-beta-glucosidase n=1 Tax=Tepidimicrobium xylanilyticum TaxID=1123352 RepID=A0A1H3DA39_9FIRM|nr:6-phospho-beta-glucosidase [Tepidimicrobium xylanilyticum]SDX62614.1 6-phospho-beta-glucosidase [Tepidimicrobium xylanilyticum]